LLTVQNTAKQFISRRVQSVHPQLSHKLESLDIAQYGLVDGVLWQIITLFARLSSARGWYLAWVEMSFNHSSPDMVIKRIKVW